MPKSNIQAYYNVLGLQLGASQAAVKQAYRQLVKQWHPDQFAQDSTLKEQAEAKLKAINEAYRFLKEHASHEERLSQTMVPQPEATPPTSPASAGAPRNAAVSTTAKQTRISTKASHPEFYYNRGADHVKAGRYKESLDEFNTAIRLDPTYADAYRYRGFVHSLLGFELGAEADLKKAKELSLRSRKSPGTPRPT